MLAGRHAKLIKRLSAWRYCCSDLQKHPSLIPLPSPQHRIHNSVGQGGFSKIATSEKGPSSCCTFGSVLSKRVRNLEGLHQQHSSLPLAEGFSESALTPSNRTMPAYWLLKSEPEEWSWEDQVKKGVESWDGVRNALAQKNMRAMKNGDLCFFYHSVKEKAVVGIVSICREIYPDPSDESGKHGMVDVKAVKPLVQPVTLAEMKADPVFADLILLRQSRLSVVPLEKKHWDRINELGSVKREEEPKKPRKRAKKKGDVDPEDGEEVGAEPKDGTTGEERKEGVEDLEGAAEAPQKESRTNEVSRKRLGKSKAAGANERVEETKPSSGKKAPKKRKVVHKGEIDAEVEEGTELQSKTVKSDTKPKATGRRSGRLKARTA